MSGPKIAALYGFITNKLGLCGPRQDLLKKFIAGKLSIPQILPVLEKFEGAYPYYQLIAQKNKVETGPFNKKVVEAYWLGNELLDKVTADDLRELIATKFSRPGLLPKKVAAAKVKQIPEDSKPHHSFHVLVLGSVTGSVDFTDNTKLKDICRVGWGRVIKKFKVQSSKFKVIVTYQPLIGKKRLRLGESIKKEIFWNKELVPKVKVGDWVSFHWGWLVQVLTPQEVINLKEYTVNTLKSLV